MKPIKGYIRVEDLPSVEEIRRIIIDKELIPAVSEDSGQCEWTVGESRTLAQAIHDLIESKAVGG